jgi:hypothetical protein
MTGIGEWQARVGSAWADEWRRTDRSFTAVAWIVTAKSDQSDR